MQKAVKTTYYHLRKLMWRKCSQLCIYYFNTHGVRHTVTNYIQKLIRWTALYFTCVCYLSVVIFHRLNSDLLHEEVVHGAVVVS